jgi:alcohol dehydrogenase
VIARSGLSAPDGLPHARSRRQSAADHVIDYARGDFMAEVHARFGKPHRRRRDGGVDVVINFTGGDTWVPSLRCLRRAGGS